MWPSSRQTKNKNTAMASRRRLVTKLRFSARSWNLRNWRVQAAPMVTEKT
jgi:hypothetical protein